MIHERLGILDSETQDPAMTLKRRIVAGLASVLLSSQPAAAVSLADFVGQYVYAGSQDERQAILAEVDRAISELSFFLRPLARMAVKSLELTPKSIAIRWDGRLVGIQTSPAGISETPADGSLVTMNSLGRTITMQRQLTQDTLVEVTRSSDGDSNTKMTLTSGKSVLNIRSVLVTHHIPTPITLKLTYRRQR
ncbi:MAG: hypothetical protein H7338_04960 [Candidatus Sericytochromatia bacterium]|nr:hypothetical protein [Candidatus Sericytochromatia bacterium]